MWHITEPCVFKLFKENDIKGFFILHCEQPGFTLCVNVKFSLFNRPADKHCKAEEVSVEYFNKCLDIMFR